METGAVFGACFFACVLESGVLYYLPTGAISLSKRPTPGVRSAVFVNRRSLNKKMEVARTLPRAFCCVFVSKASDIIQGGLSFMSKPRFTTQQMAAAGIIAAIYAALTLLLPIPQYGGIQFRVAEAMTVLPFLFPEAIPGLIWYRR